MGGQRRYNYPKFVWSPVGGWWNVSPPNWKKNTAIAVGASALITLMTIQFSWSREVLIVVVVVVDYVVDVVVDVVDVVVD